MAAAMISFPAELEARLPSARHETKLAIARFLGKQYASLAKRYEAARRAGTLDAGVPPLAYYCDLMDQSSPVPLDDLVWHMAARLKLIDAFALWRALGAALREARTKQRPLADPALASGVVLAE